MKNFTKGMIVGSMAVGTVLSASMMTRDKDMQKDLMKSSKKAMKKAEDLLNM